MNKTKVETILNKYLVDLVYNAAVIEGINTKYLDIEQLIAQGIKPSLHFDDLSKVLNLIDAYLALKETNFLNQPIDLYSLKKINQIINGRGLVKEAGKVRIDEVYILNCKYIPPIPDEYEVNNSIIDIINKDGDPLDKGIELYLYIMRTQPFIDGNKRTANLFANLYLLQNDCPIISIHANKKKSFLTLLSKFYESTDSSKITEFIKKEGLYNIS